MKKLLSLIILFVSHGLFGMYETRTTADKQTITHSKSDTGERYHLFGPSDFDTSYFAIRYGNQYTAEKTDHSLIDTITVANNPQKNFNLLGRLFEQSTPID